MYNHTQFSHPALLLVQWAIRTSKSQIQSCSLIESNSHQIWWKVIGIGKKDLNETTQTLKFDSYVQLYCPGDKSYNTVYEFYL